jgi:hypothetical protein
VRRACRVGDQENNRREWIESRLKELARCFAVAVGGFSGDEQSFARCDTWSISPGVLPDERILSCGSDRGIPALQV